MKKVIGIFCGNNGTIWDSETAKTTGLGGSETWAIELAKRFSKKGFYTIVFGTPSKNFIDEDGVEYVNVASYPHRLQYQHFDYFICSRQVDPIVNELDCKNVYVMVHDTTILQADIPKLVARVGRVAKYFALSNYHKNHLEQLYRNIIIDNTCSILFNGINPENYSKTYTKENQMVWSSKTYRGLEPFVKHVLPLILKKVPDFKIIVPQYNDSTIDNFDYSNIKNVEFVGSLTKDKLAELQLKSKIWVYPSIFNETFCITAVENAFAKNAILISDNGALKDTLAGYSNIIYNTWCDDKSDAISLNEEEYIKMARYIADEAIKMLTDDSYREQLANEAYNICRDYTWDNLANEWIKIFFPEAF